MKEILGTYSDSTFSHNPQSEIFNGEKETHQETAERAKNILAALNNSGFVNMEARVVDGMPWIVQTHDGGYVDFLQQVSNKSEETGKPFYPSVHPYWEGAKATNPIAERGRYVFDMYTPIDQYTFKAAQDSAACAVAGAEAVLQGESAVYALTRPPGHHAEYSMAGGYCYFNNAGVAAEYFLANGAKKVAIFDIDVHHGNGTQGIFYDRDDVFVANIHADPSILFPFFSGYKDETGKGAGEGCNLNIPLPAGVDNDTFHTAVLSVMDEIRRYAPDYLIISAGFDTHIQDPIGVFALTTDYYQKLGRVIQDASLPTLVVQEGGYATEILGENVATFLKGLAE